MIDRSVIQAAERFRERSRASLTQSLHTESKGPHDGGGPPGGEMLEQRVKHLEDDMKEVKADLKAIRSDLSELKGRVSMLPGYGGIALVVGVIVALSTLVQVASRIMPPSP